MPNLGRCLALALSVFVALCVALAPSPSGASPPAAIPPTPGSPAALDAEARRLGQELDDREAETHTRRDAAAVEQLWSQDFVVTNLFGTLLTRAQAMARVEKGLIQFSAMKRTVDQARRQGDLLVTIGSEELTGAAGGVLPAGKTQTLRYTHVWRNESGAWKLWVRHASIPAPDPGVNAARK